MKKKYELWEMEVINYEKYVRVLCILNFVSFKIQ